jgi:hypothetical protein
MEIFEQREEWRNQFEENWLAHLRETGQTDFTRYNRPTNDNPIAGAGVDLASSRLAFITSSGSYLLGKQEPFDAGDPLGDYSIRTYPSDTSLQDIGFAQRHYKHAAVEQDPQVLVPLDHLRTMVAEGRIGSLTSTVISFHGYVPDVLRFVDETIPQIVDIARKDGAQAALLVPA